MTDDQRLLFLTSVLREFRQALDDCIGEDDVSPQDCYDPLIKVLGRDFGPRSFHQVSDVEVKALRDEYRTWLENPTIQSSDVRKAIEAICFHWPDG